MKIRIDVGDVQISPGDGNIFFNNVVIDIETARRDHPDRKPASVFFAVPHFVTSAGDYVPMAIKIPNDAIAAVPLVFKDQAGHNLAGHTTNVSAEVQDTSLATAEITSDGQWVQITPLKTTGASTVTYRDTDDNITNTLDFSIVHPDPSGVEFNEGGTVFSANPNPPTDDTGTGTGTGTGGTGTGTGTGTGAAAAYQRAPAGISPNPATGRNVNPATGLDINPATGLDIDDTTGQDVPAGTGAQPGTGGQPGTGTQPAPGTQGTTAYAMSPVGVTPNPATGRNVNPVSGLDINPQTGLDIDANTGQDIPAQAAASRRRQP